MDVRPEWEWLFQVTLLGASNLPTVHKRNQVYPTWKQMDPYCILFFNNKDVGSSPVCKGGDTNPKWTEAFNIRVHDGVASERDAHILVYIAHLDPNVKYLHRPIGTATIPLSLFPEGREWMPVQLNVVADKNARKGETQATINVKLLKQAVPRVNAAANTSTTAAQVASSSSSSAGENIQIFLSSLQVGMEIAKTLLGG